MIFGFISLLLCDIFTKIFLFLCKYVDIDFLLIYNKLVAHKNMPQ